MTKAAHIAYMWSVEPSTGVIASDEAGPGRRPGFGARRNTASDAYADAAAHSLFSLVALSRGQGRPQAARRAWP